MMLRRTPGPPPAWDSQTRAVRCGKTAPPTGSSSVPTFGARFEKLVYEFWTRLPESEQRAHPFIQVVERATKHASRVIHRSVPFHGSDARGERVAYQVRYRANSGAY